VRPDERAWVADIERATHDLDRIFRGRIVPAVLKHDVEDVQAEHARAQLVVSTIQERADRLAARFEASIGDFQRDVAALQTLAYRWTVFFVLFAPLLAVVVGAYVLRSVAGPVARLQAGAARLARGDLDTRIDIDAPDEFGALARQFNVMTSAIKHHQEKLVQSEKLAGIGRLAAGVAELFGHARGAFTGAVGTKPGLFEEADGGTIFLDEIGELPLAVQVKLNRVLQEKEIRRVGDNRPEKVDVRVIAATHRDLKAEVAGGRFREDLFYRLNVFPIVLPALRDRREDIPLLATHFLEKHGSAHRKDLSRLEPGALRALTGYPWPGNVRELENAIERAVAVANGSAIELRDLPPDVKGTQHRFSRTADRHCVTGPPVTETASP